MGRYGNSKKKSYIGSRPVTDIENSGLASRSSFCFSFLDTNQVGQDFDDWNNSGGITLLSNVLNKIKEYTRESLSHWSECINPPLVIYGNFPDKSDFTHPKHVPHDVLWARFRLGNKVRLVGFIVPEALHDNVVTIGGNQYRLNKNVFYVVFLDKEHKFYKTEPP
jgi:hypothetical protein